MAEKNPYCVFMNNAYYDLSLRDLVEHRQKQKTRPIIWSARLSTGLFGLTNCKSGNRGPKDYNEVLLAEGDGGLRKIVELGFITCPTCKPENKPGFWNAAEGVVNKKYGMNSLEDFVDKAKLPFDARRVNWGELLPVIGAVPGRLYLPQGLQDEELLELKKKFSSAGFGLPPVGFYDASAPGRFREYALPAACLFINNL
jgi:hypothetical protein